MEQKPGRYNHLLEAKQQGKKKICVDDSKGSASVSAFFIFHFILQCVSLFETGEEAIMRHCTPERPK